MNYFVLALIAALLGVLPFGLRAKKITFPFVLVAFGLFLLDWFIFYYNSISLVRPLFGAVSLVVGFPWILYGILLGWKEKEYDRGFISSRPGITLRPSVLLPIGYVAALIIALVAGSHMLNADRYSALLGKVEERDWTKDVQPKDPKHMRMVSEENALYIAKKAVANAGAIGSQFSLDWDYVTLQKVNGHLVYVLPFDYNGFTVWQSTSGAPGYIVVDAEDPERAPRLVELPEGKRMRYMPNAFFGDNLERYLRQNGFLNEGLATARFELDEKEEPHWVIPLWSPVALWSGSTLTGVAVVNPATGDIKRYKLGEIPAWIDRAVPAGLVETYIDERGEYFDGWWNAFWAKTGVTEAENPILVVGSDDNLEWVTGVTSKSANDDSLIGLMYTNSRTGKSVFYRTNGGAIDNAIMAAVDKHPQVNYKKLHASTPQTYNVYGVMTSVVPLLNDNHAFQGVALVRVANPQDVAVGITQSEALRNYQSVIFRSGEQIALSKSREVETLAGTVDRIRQDVSGNGSLYYFHLSGVSRIFTVSSGDHVKVTLTQPGDSVRVSYVASHEETVPVESFDNLSLPLDKTADQKKVEAAVAEKVESERAAITLDGLKAR
ncbi:MAG TPA: hypothetical protein VFT82_02130 [Candidatus Paceibacterota bacterium]|nr:hypothetical protein [Candidatus Paceibacterota bacterium]